MSFHLVRDGVFQEAGISELLTAAGTRNLSDNLSDLKAQVAANQQGILRGDSQMTALRLENAGTLDAVHFLAETMTYNNSIRSRNSTVSWKSRKSAFADCPSRMEAVAMGITTHLYMPS